MRKSAIVVALVSSLTCGIAFGQETDESRPMREQLRRAEQRARAESVRSAAAGSAEVQLELARTEADLSNLEAKQRAQEGRPGDRSLRSRREATAGARRQPMETRPAPQGPLEELVRKLRHLRSAAENLRAAGMNDLAEAVARRAEGVEREMRDLADRQPPRPFQAPGGDRGEIESLRRELQELREEVRRLRAERRPEAPQPPQPERAR